MGNIELALSTVKKLRELSKEIQNLDLKQLIVDLRSQILDLKEELLELRQENIELRSRFEQIARQTEIRAKLEMRGNAYYLTEPIEGYPDGPFCTTCFDVEGTLVVLHRREHIYGTSSHPKTETFITCGRCARNQRK